MAVFSRKILIKRVEREKIRKCIYLVDRIIHFRHKSWYQNLCLLKVRSSLDLYLVKGCFLYNISICLNKFNAEILFMQKINEHHWKRLKTF